MLKKIIYITLSLCMTFSLVYAPLKANSSPYMPVLASNTSPSDQSNIRPGGNNCKPCQRPFKRLVKAMHDLKKANEMTDMEFKRAYDAIVKIPKQKFKDAKDPDLTAAEILYKTKTITDEQYKKIGAALKQMPPASNAPQSPASTPTT